MEVYMVEQEDLKRLPESDFDKEVNLENRLIRTDGATIGGVDVMYIGRQGTPDEGGIFDILGLDEDGNTVIVELKRGKAPREIAAQAFEYASGIRKEDYDQLDDRYREFVHEYGTSPSFDETPILRDRHQTYFGLDEPVDRDDFNDDQRLVLVGTEFRDVTLNMADFLREHDIDVVCVEYSVYSQDEVELLLTENIRRPLSEEPTSTVSPASDKEDYGDLILSVRDQIFQEVHEQLQVDERDELATQTNTRQMSFRSAHPDHPQPLAYAFKPRIEEQGIVTFGVHVKRVDGEKREILREFLVSHAEALEGYELADDPTAKMFVLSKEVEVTDNVEVGALARELADLITYLHPHAVEKFAHHELFE